MDRLIFKSSSIECCDIAGKGRGFIANQDLGPHEKLLIETPLICWDRGHYDPIKAIKSVYHDLLDQKSHLQLHLSTFSPRSLDILKSSQRYQASCTLTGQGFEGDALARMFFVLETNAFPTGLYETLAICNHSCSPNAQVIEEETVGGKTLLALETLSNIKKGDEILISYLENPQYRFFEERQRQLLSQYLFECKCTRCEYEHTNYDLNNSDEVFKCPISTCPGKLPKTLDKCNKCDYTADKKYQAKVETKLWKLQRFKLHGDSISLVTRNEIQKLAETILHPDHFVFRALSNIHHP